MVEPRHEYRKSSNAQASTNTDLFKKLENKFFYHITDGNFQGKFPILHVGL